MRRRPSKYRSNMSSLSSYRKPNMKHPQNQISTCFAHKNEARGCSEICPHYDKDQSCINASRKQTSPVAKKAFNQQIKTVLDFFEQKEVPVKRDGSVLWVDTHWLYAPGSGRYGFCNHGVLGDIHKGKSLDEFYNDYIHKKQADTGQ